MSQATSMDSHTYRQDLFSKFVLLKNPESPLVGNAAFNKASQSFKPPLQGCLVYSSLCFATNNPNDPCLESVYHRLHHPATIRNSITDCQPSFTPCRSLCFCPPRILCVHSVIWAPILGAREVHSLWPSV